MDNTSNNTPSNPGGSSSMLFIGIILGILILGGVFLYMREQNPSTKPNEPVKDSIEADVTVPIRNDGEQSQ